MPPVEPSSESDLPARLLELASSCFVGDLDTATQSIVEHAADHRAGYICFCNAHVLTHALHDLELRRVLSGAALRLPDGAPVAWLLRRLGRSHARRIGGPDLFPRVVDRGRAAGLRHFLVGSTDANLARLGQVLVERYPGAQLAGSYAPPYGDEPEVERALVEMVHAARPHAVWVALGAPKQELWMSRASPLLPGATLLGVGAAFDFVAGTKSRAPAWMQRVGLEWLHRMASEPHRLTSRYVRANSEFIVRASSEFARVRLGRRSGGAGSERSGS